MGKTKRGVNDQKTDLRDYQKLIENLRIRLNVLNASFFLLEDKLTSNDLNLISYLSRINSELERIRKMLVTDPASLTLNNENHAA
jgi:hypothetical protein